MKSTLNAKPELKFSSSVWKERLCPRTKIVDPDGWDRSDLEKSWEEPITKDEFLMRLFVSTLYIADDLLCEKQ